MLNHAPAQGQRGTWVYSIYNLNRLPIHHIYIYIYKYLLWIIIIDRILRTPAALWTALDLLDQSYIHPDAFTAYLLIDFLVKHMIN